MNKSVTKGKRKLKRKEILRQSFEGTKQRVPRPHSYSVLSKKNSRKSQSNDG